MMWEYLFVYAPKGRPTQATFWDEGQIFRDVELNTLGAHGWELVSVFPGTSETGEVRYEYWFKRPKEAKEGPAGEKVSTE